MLKLEVKAVMKWAQKKFGYYGHLTEIGKICGVNRSTVHCWSRGKYVPSAHQEKLISASDGKLKLVEVK